VKELHHSLILLLLPSILLGQVSIQDIQYTTNAGDGTYPSPLVGQTVTTGGIVTANNYSGGRYFISSSDGGPWNSIYIYDNSHAPAIGDSIIIQGEVYEYHGFSELKNLDSYELVSSGNPLPAPASISTQELASQEAYESVYVELTDVEVTETYDTWDEWRVNDGSGECILSNQIFNLAESEFPLLDEYPFASIGGVVSFSWGDFRLHPRSIDDLVSAESAFIISAGEESIYTLEEYTVPVNLTLLGNPTEISSLDIDLSYDPAIVQYAGFSQPGTLSEGVEVTDVSAPGQVILSLSGDMMLHDLGTVINMHFVPNSAGFSPLTFESTALNGSPIPFTLAGEIGVFINGIPIGDTLTVIQRPLMNIPDIVVPGETLQITCLAPHDTRNWDAALEYGSFSIDLEVNSSEYIPALDRWYLEAVLPEPPFYELFDLHVTATGLDDVTRNSVRLIPERKAEYDFIHITDTHLATHYFYEDPESISDTSEMVDLRAVIQDINLINPEFVLVTGDIVNEGELEDFENRRNFTKAQRILEEFEVPVYLVTGNHDVGGWDATPPPDGTGRHNWWRFFGWPWLNDPPEAELLYTQDYSFDYGPIHFVGLEAYINYDDYRWEIYGNTSFIPSQLEWLAADLATSEAQTKVLFYHYDFEEELDLEALEVDMALWGHIHSNSGCLYQQPFDLSTETVCDDNRAYRVIRVSDGYLQPEETVYASWPQEMMQVSYSGANDGSMDTLTAVIENEHNLGFEHGLIKFVMPAGDFGYSLSAGILDQVVNTGTTATCYVSVNIPPNSSISVTIAVDTTLTGTEPIVGYEWQLSPNYPNPFNPETVIQYELSQESVVTISVFDLNGRTVKTLTNATRPAGKHQTMWDGRDEYGNKMASGVYLVRMESPGNHQTRKLTLMK